MKKKRFFDEDLLTKSKEERKGFFKGFTVPHPKMNLILNELKNEIYSGDSNVVLVVGPSGVGKSRLFLEAILSVYKDMAEQLETNKGIVPITGIELPNPDLGRFNYKDFYYRVLIGLKEPLIDDKIDVDKLIGKAPKKKKKIYDAETAAELRRSIESAFTERKTKALLIDEAQHFFKLSSKNTDVINTRQFNSIKSLANMAGSKIVLFGTYDLNQVINLDGQLSRRVKEIHFMRYDYRKEEDIKMFKTLLFTFQGLLPVEVEPNLLEQHEYIYEGSLGCAGILKNWLMRCLSDAIDNDEETITIDNLKRNSLHIKKLVTLANEATSGESYFKEEDKERDNLRSKLFGSNRDEEEYSNQKRRGSNNPGKRNPTRDIVGTNQSTAQ